MATNTYTYGSLGQRWTVGEATTKTRLDIARNSADANRWTLTQLVTNPDNDANFALINGTTATTQSASDNSTKIATTAYADNAGSSISFSGSTASGMLKYSSATQINVASDVVHDSGVLSLSSSTQGALRVNSSHNTKMYFQGTTDPLVYWAESSTNVVSESWDSTNHYFKISQLQDSTDLRIGAGASGLQWTYVEGGSPATKTVWHSGNDGSGSGLDADTLDGVQGASYAPLASPALTGTPTAPTAGSSTNTTQIATTAYVTTAVAAGGGGGGVAGSDSEIQYNNGGSMGGDADFVWDDTNHRLGINVTPTDSLSVTGTLKAGKTWGSGFPYRTADKTHELGHDASDQWATFISHEHPTNPYGLAILYPNKDTSSTTSNAFFTCYDSGYGTIANIKGNGNFGSATNSYGSTSDIKLKQDIEDANLQNQWDDIKAVKLRNFRYKSRPQTRMLGVIAQELEEVSPNLIEEDPDVNPQTNENLGTTTKFAKYSVLYLKAVGALQVAMSKIEDLEQRVETLENA